MSARTDLCGGYRATDIPTAILGRFIEPQVAGHRAGTKPYPGDGTTPWANQLQLGRMRIGASTSLRLVRSKEETICRDFDPDLGKRAVRNYRGPSGNAATVKMLTRLAIERAMTVTLHLQPARRSSIPTSKIKTHFAGKELRVAKRRYSEHFRQVAVERMRGCESIVALTKELGVIDQLWVADITYIRLKTEFVYLAVILDGFSRKVVGWSLERDLSSRLATAALEQAIATRRPAAGLVHHSDRGVQYASAEYVAVLEKHGMIPSMSRPANPYDNASCESFMKTLKREEIYANQYNDLVTFAFPHRRIYRPILQPATIALCLGLPFSRRI